MGKNNRKPKAKPKDTVGQLHSRLTPEVVDHGRLDPRDDGVVNRAAANRIADQRFTEGGQAIKELGEKNLLGANPPLSRGKLGFTTDLIGKAKHFDEVTPVPDLGGITARDILAKAHSIDPEHVRGVGTGRYTDEQINELISQHPHIALEGLTKLGRVLTVPHVPEDVPTFNPLEIKARTVADLRAGQFDTLWSEERPEWDIATHSHLNSGVPIDVQATYDRWMSLSKGNDLYEMQLAPPWPNAILVYNSESGNVWVMHMLASDIRTDPEWTPEYTKEIQWQPTAPATHEVDWDRIRWVYSVQVYVGGLTVRDDHPGTYVRAVGPMMIWRIAVYEDGMPADVHWTHIAQEVSIHKFNNALGTLTEAINMSNCANVHIAEPTRPMSRPQRRRLDRIGVRFSEIHIRPVSKSYRGKGTALADMEMPLHGVKGHYANYGKDGRGLLFGKYSGRFWIPPHVRGSAAQGEVMQSYVAET